MGLSVTKPRALRPGDLIGVCAPSGPVEPERLARGVAQLEALGFRVRVRDGLLERSRFTAGSAARRVAELHTLFADPEVAAIACARGGAGALHLLALLDAELLRAHPKPFLGYSDATVLHAVLGRLGQVTLHGPMLARGLDSETGFDRASLLHGLRGEGAPLRPAPEELLPLRSGSGSGRLRGGCLSLLAALTGTPWGLAPDPEGTLLFLEDAGEKPYRIDRMLRQLRSAGALASVRGIVFGDMVGCSPGLRDDYALEDVILEALDGLEVPVALGLSSGHAAGPGLTLPLGVLARLECGEHARFEVLEPAVA